MICTECGDEIIVGETELVHRQHVVELREEIAEMREEILDLEREKSGLETCLSVARGER